MRRERLDAGPHDAVVDGFTYGGEGVARVRGKAVFVPGTLPGERVRLRVTDDRKRWARATLVEVMDPSPDRVEPPCPYVPECGGCDLQHAAVEAQRRLKTRVVIEQLQRLGGIDVPPVEPCRAAGPATGYRAQARLHADEHGRLGFHRAGTNDVVPIDTCLVLTDEAQALREAVGDDTGAAEAAVRVLDPAEAGTVVLAPGPGPLELPDGGFDVLLEQPDGTTAAMRGDGRGRAQVAGLTYTVPASAFFQVGHHAAEALVAAVLEAVGDVHGALSWDLYAGVGLLSLPLARAGAEVVAVEGHAAAAEAAMANAAANGLALRVLAEPVAEVTRRAARGSVAAPDGVVGTVTGAATGGGSDAAVTALRDPPDVVVLDPPRSGAGRAVVDDLVRLAAPTLVYVACDVAALARDTAHLVEGGYHLQRVVPLDLFPMTHHVEAIATFSR